MNDFCESQGNQNLMKGSTLILALIVLFTFPVWIGMIAGGFGLIIGIIGAIVGGVFGLIGAVFGAIGGIFGAVFNGVFGWGDHCNFISFPHFHLNGFSIAAVIIIAALVLGRRKSIREKDVND
ncbi:MAG: hypothetical protein KF860_09245 [Cyclobacteriaceae bacterium]|nr:hypothetical protein [Cyclobacteriaceae bacterium]